MKRQSARSTSLLGESPIFTLIIICKLLVNITRTFKLVGFILLLTNLIIVIFISQIPSDFRCPNCGCAEFIDYGEFIECKNCRLEYFKEFIGSEIDEENLLTDQELEGLSGSFSELKDEKTRRRFLKSIDEDLEDLNDFEE